MNVKETIFQVYQSFRALPGWVQAWMMFWLVPVNLASLLFLQEPHGILIAVLANVAMLLNVPVMFLERRMSRTMALPHLPFWTPLVIYILWVAPDIGTVYGKYLWLLAATNLVSLAFDYADAVRWLKGDRN